MHANDVRMPRLSICMFYSCHSLRVEWQFPTECRTLGVRPREVVFAICRLGWVSVASAQSRGPKQLNSVCPKRKRRRSLKAEQSSVRDSAGAKEAAEWNIEEMSVRGCMLCLGHLRAPPI